MSLEAMVWAFKQHIEDAREKLVLLSLANYADQNGVCWPGYEKLKLDTAIRTNATISDRLKSIEEKGLISRKRRPKVGGGSTSNLYVLNLALILASPWETPKVHQMNYRPEFESESSRHELSESSRHELSESSRHELSISIEACQLIETSQFKYILSDSFENWWKNYPKRQGGRGKKKTAENTYQKLVKSGHSEQALLDAIIRYRNFCEATGKIQTEYVVLETTFLNNPDNLENPWTVYEIPKPTNQQNFNRHETYAELIFNAPGCESLSDADQESLFGERPVQDFDSQVADEVQGDVSAEFDS